VRNNGRRVAKHPAMIPSPGSTVDQIAMFCASAKNVRLALASFGMYLNRMQEAIPPLSGVSDRFLK
jgi:hypothetical protein